MKTAAEMNLRTLKIFCSREHLGKDEDVVFPELSGGGVDPVLMDFILLTQTNHSIYDYGSFGFWGAVMAGGMTMLADGYRFPHQESMFRKFGLKKKLFAARDRT